MCVGGGGGGGVYISGCILGADVLVKAVEDVGVRETMRGSREEALM